jgi:hypothetical protein
MDAHERRRRRLALGARLGVEVEDEAVAPLAHPELGARAVAQAPHQVADVHAHQLHHAVAVGLALVERAAVVRLRDVDEDAGAIGRAESGDAQVRVPSAGLRVAVTVHGVADVVRLGDAAAPAAS